jgi:hypothetical protein
MEFHYDFELEKCWPRQPRYVYVTNPRLRNIVVKGTKNCDFLSKSETQKILDGIANFYQQAPSLIRFARPNPLN